MTEFKQAHKQAKDTPASKQCSPSRRLVLRGSAAGAIAGLGALVTEPAKAQPAWTDRDKSIATLTADPIVGVRTGVHPSYERLVLDFAGSSPGGAWIGYSQAFWAMGTGAAYLVGATPKSSWRFGDAPTSD